MATAQSRPLILLLLLGAIIALATLAYHPGLSGPFLFDDYANIVNEPQLQIDDLSWASLKQASLSGAAGPLKRPLSTLSFGLNHAVAGLDEFSFKSWNLATHLINGLLVFLFCRRLGRLAAVRAPRMRAQVDWIALATCALWVLHPALLSSVLYVVQRMTSLASTFLLLALLAYLHARQRQMAGHAANWTLFVGVPLLTAIATLTKEIGALLPFLAFSIEAGLLRFHCGARPLRRHLEGFFALFLLLPLVGMGVFLAAHPEWLSASAPARGFTAVERLLTECRVLLFYLKLLFVPAISELALYYDDFPISRGLLTPVSTLFALITWTGLVLGACCYRNRAPMFAFAVFWFLAAHALESSFIMLEIMHLHRNYLAYVGPLLASVWGLFAVCAHRPRLLLLLLGCIGLTLALVTWQRATQWRSAAAMAQFELRHRPDSPRANYELGRLFAQAYGNDRRPHNAKQAERHLQRAAELEPENAGPLIGLVLLDFNRGGTPAPALLDSVAQRLAHNRGISLQIPYVRSLVTCQEDAICKLTPDQMVSLLAAVLNNPALDLPGKSQTLVLLGAYYCSVGDAAACLRVLQDAAEIVPDDPVPLLSLIQAYLLTGNLDQAGQALRHVHVIDKLGGYASSYSRYEDRLRELRATHHGPP